GRPVHLPAQEEALHPLLDTADEQHPAVQVEREPPVDHGRLERRRLHAHGTSFLDTHRRLVKFRETPDRPRRAVILRLIEPDYAQSAADTPNHEFSYAERPRPWRWTPCPRRSGV